MADQVDLATLRRLIKIGGYTRATLGVFLLVMPSLAALWLGPDARRPAVKALIRIVAIRDLILGAGSIVAANEGQHLRRWVEFTMIADGVDAVASVTAIRHTPRLRGALMAATAAGAAAAGAGILSQLPEEVPSTA